MNNNLIATKVKACAQIISQHGSKLEKYFLFWGIIWMRYCL